MDYRNINLKSSTSHYFYNTAALFVPAYVFRTARREDLISAALIVVILLITHILVVLSWVNKLETYE